MNRPRLSARHRLKLTIPGFSMEAEGLHALYIGLLIAALLTIGIGAVVMLRMLSGSGL
jgi:hypothetical protein